MLTVTLHSVETDTTWALGARRAQADVADTLLQHLRFRALEELGYAQVYRLPLTDELRATLVGQSPLRVLWRSSDPDVVAEEAVLFPAVQFRAADGRALPDEYGARLEALTHLIWASPSADTSARAAAAGSDQPVELDFLLEVVK